MEGFNGEGFMAFPKLQGYTPPRRPCAVPSTSVQNGTRHEMTASTKLR